MSKIKIYIEFVFSDQPRRLPDHKVLVVNSGSESIASSNLREALLTLRKLDMLKFINALEVFNGEEQVKSEYFLRECKLEELITETLKLGSLDVRERRADFYNVLRGCLED